MNPLSSCGSGAGVADSRCDKPLEVLCLPGAVRTQPTQPMNKLPLYERSVHDCGGRYGDSLIFGKPSSSVTHGPDQALSKEARIKEFSHNEVRYFSVKVMSQIKRHGMCSH
eukprot:CAMPEP_0185778134 /NCGR_PEP_ID=MMETSP1174-20130828/91631_1 /TAXON_ID=35687 /ORGANISM="Dictyocha speculum, Strain CCMP1381" /LENGTH=110 /DNA_ID=CAMNT_0028466741 /DNA_START=179 /DNA_END=511 /DNA_ORIENTATION=+